jgi:hypothetical protein
MLLRTSTKQNESATKTANIILMQENVQNLVIEISRTFYRRRRSSVLQWRNTDYHVLYTTLTFQAGTTAI